MNERTMTMSLLELLIAAKNVAQNSGAELCQAQFKSGLACLLSFIKVGKGLILHFLNI